MKKFLIFWAMELSCPKLKKLLYLFLKKVFLIFQEMKLPKCHFEKTFSKKSFSCISGENFPSSPECKNLTPSLKNFSYCSYFFLFILIYIPRFSHQNFFIRIIRNFIIKIIGRNVYVVKKNLRNLFSLVTYLYISKNTWGW